MAKGDTFFAGIGEEGRPGGIQIWKYAKEGQDKASLEKVNEV